MNGERWSPEEDMQLRAEFHEGVGLREIAQRHDRSCAAIVSRLCDKHKLLICDDRTKGYYVRNPEPWCKFHETTSWEEEQNDSVSVD